MSKKLNGRIPTNFLVAPKPELRFVVPGQMKAGGIQALENILMLFGPGGRNWIKGDEHLRMGAGETLTADDRGFYGKMAKAYKTETLRKAFDGFCLIGGVKKVDGAYEGIARVALSLAIAQKDSQTAKRYAAAQQAADTDGLETILIYEGTITDFNDSDKTTFKDIRAVVVLAKKLVREADEE